MNSASAPNKGFDPTQAVRNALGGGDTKGIVEYCDEKFELARTARLQFERQWYLNLAFYFGKQWVQWASQLDTNYARLWVPPAPPWRVRYVANRIKSVIRSELAKVTKEKPTGYVVPQSTDDDDLLAAQAGENIFEHQWRTLGAARILRRALFWTLLTGTGIIKDFYDPAEKDLGGVQGRITLEPVSPFHLWVSNVDEEEIENQEYVIHGISKSAEWVQWKFQKHVPPDSGSSGGTFEQKFLSAIGIRSQKKDHVSVKEIWFKPNARFPSGAHIIWAGQEVLVMDDFAKNEGGHWSYNHGQYPFTKLDHIPTGKFYHDSTIVDLIAPQKEYNRTRSQIVESKNRMSKPQLLAARGSVDAKKITSEPGLVIFYTPGFPPPTPLPLQSIPGYVIEELNRNLQDMDDISSRHDVSQGRTPPGVTAASAISYLQEQDDTPLALTVSSVEEGIEKLGRHILSHAQQFWDSQRTIQVVGVNGQFEAFEYSRQDVVGGTDFHVEPGSAMPRSIAAKQAFIMDAVKIGLVPPDQGLRYLDMAETKRMYEESQLDSRQAQQENMRMMQGEQVEINSWDNDAAHVAEHDRYRKRQAFITADDQVKQTFETHVTMHKQRIFQIQTGGQAPPGAPELDTAAQGLPQGQPAPGQQLMPQGQPPGPPPGPPPPGPGGDTQGA